MNSLKRPKRALWLSVWAVICAAVLVAVGFLTWYATTWDRALTGYFGSLGKTVYTSEELPLQQKELELRIVDEGGVLLQNDNDALPLEKGSKVSVFGITNQMWMTKEKLSATKDTVFLESLEAAGLEINTSLRKFYRQSPHTAWGNGANLGDGSIAGNWTIDEVPQSEYTQEVKDSYAQYADAAIVVFTRGGSEGGDLPRHMGRFGGSDSEHYLELSKNEEDLLAAIQAAGCFEKTIVVLHTTNAMQMDFLQAEEYGVDAVLWISGTGKDGVQELGKYFTGEVNPSGRNVDTYVYDNFSSPVMQNFGDFRFTKDGEVITATTTLVGGSYSYLNYGEGIYMGYKYYETRYADAVTGRGNVGNYDYASTVYAPFGYGLSYTNFEWSDFSASEPDKNGDFTVSVKVTNTGDVAGKEVVQFYYSAPYTAGGTEKAAINLADFGKTQLLEPGDAETVEVRLNIEDMASYDSETEEAYVLDAGSYYITAASDAHRAVNNVLAAQGYTTADGMTEEGAAAFVQEFALERTVYKQAHTGADYQNLFEDAELPDAQYLSRSNWAVLDTWNKETGLGGITYASGTQALGTEKNDAGAYSATTDSAGTVRVQEASEEIYNGLTSEGWDVSGNPVPMDDAGWSAVSYNSKNSELMCADMIGVDYDDESWYVLAEKMSQAEQLDIVGRAGWGTGAVESVGKPQTTYLDGPQGMIDYISGGQGYQFTDTNMVGATWNKELAAEEGDLVSQEFALKGASMWWAPALNIHRSPFSGRNFEYFSEDGVHCGLMGVEMVKAAQDNGVLTTLKHFFLNDQETNRNSHGKLATFATEQSMREIYAKGFQICVEEGDAHGIMASMCRIGWRCAPLDYSSMTALLRGEWGYHGTVITDAQSLAPGEAEQALAAGCDMVCRTSATQYLDSTLESAGGQYMLREAAKNILYVTVNSIAISSDFNAGFPIYKLLLIAVWVVVALYLAYGTGEVLLKLYPEQTVISKKCKWIVRGVLWAVAAGILVTLAVMFFTTWLPALEFAFQTV